MFIRLGRRVSAAVTVVALCFFSSPAGAANASTYNDPYAKQVVDLMNSQRAAAGLPALRWNQAVSNISQDWSNHLATATNSPAFSFATIHRPDAGANEIPAGADWYREIIGFNFAPADVVDWWAGSSAHRDAMLSGCATDVGIGYTVPTSGPYAGFHLVVSNLAGYPDPGAVPVRNGAILSVWVAQGCAAGRLGAPVALEGPAANGGVSQSFQHGTVYWSPTSGAHTVWGGIRGEWGSQGFEAGRMGYPTSDEIPAANGGVYQNFMYGTIYWSPATGAHTVWGGIRGEWGSQGFEAGRMGYPTTDEIPAANGGIRQAFQYGALYWSPASGAHISWGGIRAAWGAQGYEAGPLGYPVTDEYTLGPGIVGQDYQGGRITWSAATGTKVTLRS
ncbi:CAP domain-containing protein [Arthrobacter oryzae]|uniref:LGFP repeat-containing protein n=1 Tax=Arthrobacter oryzae TaxID=409290 RepID=A0A495ECN4_9MICC|nr:CAP domain-containing protein [Arthrobacter oryzae]RKR13677.1 LGFP repeat-containing protein [Arthrobacter oryzae]